MARRKRQVASNEMNTEYYEPIETTFVGEDEPTQVARGSRSKSNRMRPALTPEARENQLIALAVDEAERQLLEHTASSQVITHFLKLATAKERLEQERLKGEIELQKAKIKALDNAEEIKVLYENAIKAMRMYGGQGGYDEPDDEDY